MTNKTQPPASPAPAQAEVIEQAPAAPPAGLPEIYRVIATVARELSVAGISKSRKNAQQGFNFRGIDEVLNALSPIMVEAGLIIIPRMISRECQERATKSGGSLFYVVVCAEFDFVAIIDGSKVTVRMFGEAMDSGDKATNKAMSIAYKYAAFQTFCIPIEGFGEDPDATTHDVAHNGNASRAPIQQPQRTSAAYPTTPQASHSTYGNPAPPDDKPGWDLATIQSTKTMEGKKGAYTAFVALCETGAKSLNAFRDTYRDMIQEARDQQRWIWIRTAVSGKFINLEDVAWPDETQTTESPAATEPMPLPRGWFSTTIDARNPTRNVASSPIWAYTIEGLGVIGCAQGELSATLDMALDTSQTIWAQVSKSEFNGKKFTNIVAASVTDPRLTASEERQPGQEPDEDQVPY